MSTRATILLTYKAGNTIQLYHHCDGYPEYMGKLLESFCSTAYFMRYGNNVDEVMYKLLKMEKHFEFEDTGIRHTDIEYVWYVKLEEDGFEVSYTEVNPELEEIYTIKDDEEFCKKHAEILDNLLSARKGKVVYA